MIKILLSPSLLNVAADVVYSQQLMFYCIWKLEQRDSQTRGGNKYIQHQKLAKPRSELKEGRMLMTAIQSSMVAEQGL